MKWTRREFVRDGVAAFTVGFAAPGFLSDLAQAQGARSRNLIVLYLSGGNDSLSMLVPYTDNSYYSRRPTIFVPAANVLQVGSDASGKALGLHPRLTGIRTIFDQGRLALIQRTGYENSSRSHFLGTDIWSTASPTSSQGPGWLGRYLDLLPSPIDPLVGWNTARETPHALQSRTVAVPAIPSVTGYAFMSPNGTGTEAQAERATAARIASHISIDEPHLSFVNANAQAALSTLDRVRSVTSYAPTVTYADANPLAQAFKAVAGAMVKGIGTKVFWVTTGGYDTHSAQNPSSGAYANLMATLNDALTTFYNDLGNQGLLGDTLILQFSEFGRRINENGSGGTDHGAGSVMMAIGGAVRGGLYGTAANLSPDPQNPTLENNANDVRYETDFRSVYAAVVDNWLGAESVKVLGSDFRKTGLNFL